jgi:hypothetical protein
VVVVMVLLVLGVVRVVLCVVVVRIVRSGERRELVFRVGGQRSYVTTVVE